MWILDSEGDVLKGKRYWLRPGQEYTLGRTPQSRIDLSSFKTVSKTHITIKVGTVEKGSASNLNIRSSITIQDHDSKFGTWLDDVDIKNKIVKATSKTQALRLAKMPGTLRLRWQPIVFTNAGARATKVNQLIEKLEPFDIKFVKDYSDSTTYVMALKANTAKGLTALIQQKHVVTDMFGDALYSALSSAEDILDDDFLPDPLEFVPTTEGYPAEIFRPNPARAELFKGLTFIFLDEKQYDNLVTPINAALGKAVFFDPEGKRVDDLIKYASTKGTVVLVERNWDQSDELCRDASKRLGHEPMNQSSFLDPILKVDRSLILRPVETGPESTQSSRTAQPPSQTSSTTFREVPDSVERPTVTTVTSRQEPASPTPVFKKFKPPPKPTTESQIDLFSDFFSNANSKATSSPTKQSRKPSIPQSATNNETDSMFPEFSPRKSQTAQATRSRRPVQVIEEEPDEDFAPTATEMRKHLAEKPSQETTAPDQDDESDAISTKAKSKSSAATKGKKRPAEDEVIEAAKERKRTALEQSKKAAEELAAAVKDHEHLRNLGEVELFTVDLNVPQRRPGEREDRSTRWNPIWNGRKNFKKFRKANQSISVGIGREMIQLVDYQGKSNASQEFFFAAPLRGTSQRNGTMEDSVTDLTMEDSPTQGNRTRSSRGTRSTMRSSRSSNSRMVARDDSDNDLGFDSE